MIFQMYFVNELVRDETTTKKRQQRDDEKKKSHEIESGREGGAEI